MLPTAALLLLVSCRAAAPQLDNLVQPANVQSTASPAAPIAGLPALTGRVVDNAELLTPRQEAVLGARSEALERRTGAQFVIATLPSLGGRPIADVSTDLGNHWRLGRAGRNDGLLLLVAPNERQVRLAVGDGLIAAFADAAAQQIIDRDMLPAFRESRFFDGIDAGSRAVVARVERAGQARR